MKAPNIELRDQRKLADQLRQYIARFASEWPDADAVAASANVDTLVQLFARMQEILQERLNQVPDKNFLSFLEMLGIELQPSRSASTPLAFTLTESSETGGVVPQGTQVAVEGTESDPVIFETREDLSLILPVLTVVNSLEPAKDRYTDHAVLTTDGNEEVQSLLEGRTLVPHRLYIGQAQLLELEDEALVSLDVIVKHPVKYSSDIWNINWFTWDSAAGDPIPLSPVSSADPLVPADPEDLPSRLLGSGSVNFNNVKGIETRSVNGFQSPAEGESVFPQASWSSRFIYAELATQLPAGGFAQAEDIVPENLFFESTTLDPSAPYLPLGNEPTSGDKFYIGSQAVFSREDSTAVVSLELDAGSPAPVTAGVELTLYYWDGAQWTTIGRTSEAGVVDAGILNLVDETNALTQSGDIKFFIPEIFSQSINLTQNLWLRIEVTTGNYGLAAAARPPVLSSTRLGYTNIPEIQDILVNIRLASEEPVKADRLLEGTAQIDQGKDFQPFGEFPEFNNVFYIASRNAFANPGAPVSLDVDLSAGAPEPDTTNIQITWEFWDGVNWEVIGTTDQSGVAVPQGAYQFLDSTNAFTASRVGAAPFPKVEFLCPDITQVEINGETTYWIRARITGGDYGQDELTKAPYLEFLKVNYDFSANSLPDMVLAENNFLFNDVSQTLIGGTVNGISVFAADPETDRIVYLGFDRAIANQPVQILFPLIDNPFNAFFRDQAENPPVIAWEYWTGTEWSLVTANDGTENLTRNDIAQVLVPGNSTARPLFGMNGNWLRLRLTSGTFALNPRVQRIHTNVVWADNRVTIADEILGSSNGEPDQAFLISRTPVLAGQQIEIREPALTLEDRENIIAEEGSDAIREVTDETGAVTDIFVRWHQVSSFGASGPQDRHYVIESSTGEITFGNGVNGFIPPAGAGNVRARSYQFGGGVGGNTTTGTVTDLRNNINFVDAVINPVPAEGGVDQESLDSLRSRGPRTLKNRDRAVSPEDFEALTREATGQVARVRALSTTEPDLSFSPGAITLIIVPVSNEVKPFPTQELINVVRDFIAERTSEHLIDAMPTQFNVIGPSYIQVFAETDVRYQNINESNEVERRIRAALNAFFNPLTGGPEGTGWEFGRDIYISEVYKVIEDVEGVDYVQRVILRTSTQIFSFTPILSFTPPAPYPEGSPLEIFRADATIGAGQEIRMKYRVVEPIPEDLLTTGFSATGFQEGDLITLRDVNGDNPVELLVTAVSGDTLTTDPTFLPATYAAGSRIEANGGANMSTIMTELPAGIEATEIKTAVPRAGDEFALIHRDIPQNRETGRLKVVSDQVNTVFVKDNFLVYSGDHIIRAAQES